jgi:hypothetical protein
MKTTREVPNGPTVAKLEDYRNKTRRRGDVSVDMQKAGIYFRRRLATVAVGAGVVAAGVGAVVGINYLKGLQESPESVMAGNIIQDTYVRDNKLVREQFAKAFEPLTNENGQEFLKTSHRTTIEQGQVKKALEAYLQIINLLNSENKLDQSKKYEIKKLLEVFDKALGQDGHNDSKNMDQILEDLETTSSHTIGLSEYIQQSFVHLDQTGVITGSVSGVNYTTDSGPSIAGP